jgi:26S proteasome non-ATPase regulatory subunit 9
MASQFADAKAAVLALDQERDVMETELTALFSQLGPAGMHEPLVDAEGFPRGDVDVHALRTLRHRIICLTNDHRALMARLTASLEMLHSLPRPAALSMPAGGLAAAKSQLQQLAATNPGAAVSAPFALIDAVSAGSPAEAAGLVVGDRLAAYEPVEPSQAGVPPSLQGFALLVRARLGQPITLTVHRPAYVRGAKEVKMLTLVPATWAGEGVLGCHAVPLQPNSP